MELGLEKVPNCECMFVHRKQGLFQSEYMDDIKMAGTKQNMAPMRKKLMKDVDRDEPTSILDHLYFGCTQRECKPNETIVERYTKMLEVRISAKKYTEYQLHRGKLLYCHRKEEQVQSVLKLIKEKV